VLDPSRPDITTEGWNTWPTERVSHALVNEPRLRRTVRVRAARMLKAMPPDVAALRLAPTIRKQIERLVRGGEAGELRDSLITVSDGSANRVYRRG
jgi:hypothetical protein